MLSKLLFDLADHVASLKEADRETDGSIWWATRDDQERRYADPTGYVAQCIERDGSAGKALQQFFDSRNPGCLARIAFLNAYTGSVDAAMMLIPAGWRVETIGEWYEPALRIRGRWQASLYSPRGTPIALCTADPSARCQHAETAALALTAAALRARALAQEPPPHSEGS